MATVGDVTIGVRELKRFLRRAWGDGHLAGAEEMTRAIKSGGRLGDGGVTERSAEADVGRLLLEVLTGSSDAKDGKG